ncbi:MAG: 5-(carboxyamino)imidazole ribonucleotide mutase [Parcubacteria group bacterium]|jgi:phosphoribosylaminoimidazole carboxylase PurE protein
MENPKVLIIMGSDSDLTVMEEAEKVLDKMGVPYKTDISSAHRTPIRTQDYAVSARSLGIKVIIAGAGMAAHLAGSIAANTTLPVIGVPIKAKDAIMDGLDALLSTVQMPTGMPVATVGLGRADNAAYLACQILGTSDPEMAERLITHKLSMESGVIKKSKTLAQRKKEEKA